MLTVFYVQKQYIEKYPDGVIPVQANDVFFTLHACLLTLITIIQCLIYEVSGSSSMLKAFFL